MPSCLELASKMTGSTSSGPPQPPKDAAPKAEQLREKITPRPQTEQPGQPMQLTPLWEHVVRTRQFPASVDAKSIFCEIFDRLRDHEWEVRQHALRVLVDVLPVLEQEIIDELMSSILPEVITNLGHPAPAVRKGALDTLRVYLCYTQTKENIFHEILDKGFNRPDALDNFQSNVNIGVILSVPSLLFPSSSSPRPPESVLKFAINSLASRLVQITHQEAALKSLARIREMISTEEFDSHMLEYNANVKREFEVLCEVYNMRIYQEIEEKTNGDGKSGEPKEIVPIIKQWSSDSDSSGAIDDCGDEEDDQKDVFGLMPPARVVLETEIKFDEETAITMTILEEKDEESDADEATYDCDSDSNFSAKDVGVVQVFEDAISERKNTRRRVRFGGEIVKLRTPDSDEASLDTPEVLRTKIPIPLFPATKMPLDHRRAFSQPTSPVHSKHPKKRSLSNSPKREIYMHNAMLSPKKSILTRSNSPIYVIQPVDLSKGYNRNQNEKSSGTLASFVKNQATLKQLPEPEASNQILEENFETKEKDDKVMSAIEDWGSLLEMERARTRSAKATPSSKESDANTWQQVDVTIGTKDSSENKNTESRTEPEKKIALESPKRSSCSSSCIDFDVFPKQERNYILLKLSSPERKKNSERKTSTNDSSFGHLVNDASFGTKISKRETETRVSDQSLNQIINNVPTTTGQTSRDPEATMASNFPTVFKSNLPNTSDIITPQIVQESESKKSSKDYGFPLSNTTDSHVSNLQSSNELFDQLKGDVKITSATIIGTNERKNGVNPRILGDKNRSFQELSIRNRHIRSAPDPESESLTCSSSEGEANTMEPSWEELGLVDQETLNDLHNKNDWRARVRGLERTASALRTSSALVTIEPRLGSLLQAVLGGEKSSRIAAAGMEVAKILISGVSEDALRRRLPQLAWGLARQGGLHAAQLARIAMLRLRPALLLEQLLQPHCLGARNGKTRENALQLLIFSLVTFPSSEFKVQIVARRVADTVGDRRRRVRQAALDTLAVLGQIYEAEEVLEAGEKAASGRHDGDAMKAAISSRLARKSLPLVSADGLVVYGLQITPNVQVARGPDVDWIVAGSGSLSPGSGRSRGQLIKMTARLDSASIFRSESARSNPWTDRPDIVAVGAGMGHTDLQQSFAWQLVSVQNQARLRGDPPPQEGNFTKAESRIPVLHSRKRGASSKERLAADLVRRGVAEISRRGVALNEIPRRMTPSSFVAAADRGSFNRLDSRETNVGYASMYQRRRRLVERNAYQGLQVEKEIPNHFSFPEQYCRLDTTSKINPEEIERHNRIARGRIDAERDAPVYDPLHRESALPKVMTGSYRSVRSLERRNRSKSKSRKSHDETELKTAPQTTRTLQATYDTYGTMYQRRQRLIEGNVFLALQATTNGTSYFPQQMKPNLTERYSRADALRKSVQELPVRDRVMMVLPTVNRGEIDVSREALHAPEKGLRRSRSRSEENELDRDNKAEIRTPLERNPNKPIEDDGDYDLQRRHAPSRSSVYEIQNISHRNSQYQVTKSVRDAVGHEGDADRPASTESSNSNISVTESHHNAIRRKSDDNRHSQNDNQSSYSLTSHNSRSSTPLTMSQTHQRTAAFNVMPFQTIPNGQNSVDSYAISMTSITSNFPEESVAIEIFDKDSSSSDINVEHSTQDKLSHDCENHNAEDDTDDTFERKLIRIRDSIHVALSSEESDQYSQKVSRESVRSIISLRKSDDSIRMIHPLQQLVQEKPSTSPELESLASRGSREIVASIESIGRSFPSYDMRSNGASENLTNSPLKSSESFADITPDFANKDREAILSSILPDDSGSLQSLGSRSFQELDRPELYSSSNSASIVRSSYSRSNEHIELEDDARENNVQLDYVPVSPAELGSSKSSLRAPSAKIVTPVAEMGQSSPLKNKLPTNQPSKVPRMRPTPRTNLIRSNQTAAQNINKPLERPKPSVQLCLTQLESKDWEVITKGLKTLSQIARQNPAQLNQCGPGTLGRVLGRHVRNLRSQVSRAACLAARDVFLSHPKGIEQEIDDIAGPLLYRTADTNKFLRADSNAALDRLVENVSAHKTIGLIVHRGATHQNAIVRATTGRLLSDIVSRIGPEQAMTLPREVRDKLLATAAKLLIDGNLDARNSAKKMFRGLLHCEGFQKGLTDAVPETTLRHIDKTLRTL